MRIDNMSRERFCAQNIKYEYKNEYKNANLNKNLQTISKNFDEFVKENGTSCLKKQCKKLSQNKKRHLARMISVAGSVTGASGVAFYFIMRGICALVGM